MDGIVRRIRKIFLQQNENFAFVFVKRILEINRTAFNEPEFRSFMLSFPFELSSDDLNSLFCALQLEEVVPKVNIVKLLIGDLSEKRKDILLNTWKKLTHGEMLISLDELKSDYRPENSLLVKTKKRTVASEKRDFEMYFAFPFMECKNGFVSLEDFMNYNNVYSSCFDDDDFFSYQIVCEFVFKKLYLLVEYMGYFWEW
jgi:hypothetical protein